MASTRELGETLRCFGLGLPGAWEDHPWGETVLKAKARVFVFLGRSEGPLRLSVKLPRSGERLLDRDCAEPTGYGLGKSGWITLTIHGEELSVAELLLLVEESYRAVAPKTLVKQLDAEQATPAPPAAKRPAKESKPKPRRAPTPRARPKS